jgi:hypothetical protein
VLTYGADGMLYDECLHHGPALLCFDSAHGHRPGAHVCANERQLIRRFRSTLDRDQWDYLFAGEACYDWEFYEFHLSYGLSGPLTISHCHAISHRIRRSRWRSRALKIGTCSSTACYRLVDDSTWWAAERGVKAPPQSAPVLLDE